MNKTLRKAMLSTICMLVVAVVSLTGVTYAWFSQGTYAEVKSLNVQVEAADGGIMIAGAGADDYDPDDPTSMPDAADYSNSLDLKDVNFGAGDGVSPVSTVGGKDAFNFFTANLVTPTEITTELDTTTNNVFKYYLFLRNENSGEDMHINLGGNGDSSVATSIGNNDNKKIENAARIGLRYVTTTNIKGAAATGSVNNTTGYGIFSMGANTTPETTPDGYLGVKGAGSQFAKDDPSLTNYLAAVDPMTATEWDILVPQDSIVVVELYVWVEGQDKDCINANANSDFTVNLVFDKVPA